MELTDLRKLQLLEVNLLLKFQKLCEENNLTYYFVGGGLIGALRHGGFVPWDDDIDIVMPREDYDRFLAFCKNGLDDGYGIDSMWNYVFSRFVDLYSVIEHPLAFESLKDNVWLDVFPVDGMPKGRLRRWLHMKHVFFLRYLLILTDIKHLAGKKKRPFYENLTLRLFNSIPLFKVLGPDKVCHALEKSMRKYDFHNSDYCCNFIGRYREKEVQPRKRWGNPAKLLFEGIEVDVPELYHEFQTHLYGNYMQLPPISERVAHEPTLLNYRKIDFEYLEKQSLKSRKVYRG